MTVADWKWKNHATLCEHPRPHWQARCHSCRDGDGPCAHFLAPHHGKGLCQDCYNHSAYGRGRTAMDMARGHARDAKARAVAEGRNAAYKRAQRARRKADEDALFNWR